MSLRTRTTAWWRAAQALALVLPLAALAEAPQPSTPGAAAPAQPGRGAARSEARTGAARKPGKAVAGKDAGAGPTIWPASAPRPGPAWLPDEPAESGRVGRCGG